MSQPPPEPPPSAATLPDWGVFDSLDCLSACWRDLRVGETTETELDEFYRNKYNGNFQISTHGDYKSYTSIVSADLKDSLLFKIQIAGLSNLTLGEILDQLGEPDYINLSYHIPSNINERGVMLKLFYPDNGFIFYFDIRGGLDLRKISDNEVEICYRREVLASKITIVQVGSIETLIGSQYPPFSSIPSRSQLSSLVDELTTWPQTPCQALPFPQP
jgi:hypothetical protein